MTSFKMSNQNYLAAVLISSDTYQRAAFQDVFWCVHFRSPSEPESETLLQNLD